jgi:hypothetical protein
MVSSRLLLAPLQNTLHCLLQVVAGDFDSQLLAVSISLAASAILMILVIALYGFAFHRQLSQEERQLREEIAALRLRLGITLTQGFPLSSEHSLALNWAWRRREQHTIVQHSYIEAAARLSLFLDFDIHKFDAFCLCLQCSGANNYRMGDALDDYPAVYRALCTWLLDISQQLIRPTISAVNLKGTEIQLSPEFLPEPKICCSLSDELRFPYFLKMVSKCRIWSESGGVLFKELKKLAQVYACPY